MPAAAGAEGTVVAATEEVAMEEADTAEEGAFMVAAVEATAEVAAAVVADDRSATQQAVAGRLDPRDKPLRVSVVQAARGAADNRSLHVMGRQVQPIALPWDRWQAPRETQVRRAHLSRAIA